MYKILYVFIYPLVNAKYQNTKNKLLGHLIMLQNAYRMKQFTDQPGNVQIRIVKMSMTTIASIN